MLRLVRTEYDETARRELPLWDERWLEELRTEQNTMRGAGAVAAPLLLGTLALVGGKDRSAGDLVRASAR